MVLYECCEDFTILTKSKDLKTTETLVRFSGHVISFCPFCGHKLMTEVMAQEEKRMNMFFLREWKKLAAKGE